jgi:hypothetical protein
VQWTAVFTPFLLAQGLGRSCVPGVVDAVRLSVAVALAKNTLTGQKKTVALGLVSRLVCFHCP